MKGYEAIKLSANQRRDKPQLASTMFAAIIFTLDWAETNYPGSFELMYITVIYSEWSHSLITLGHLTSDLHDIWIAC